MTSYKKATDGAKMDKSDWIVEIKPIYVYYATKSKKAENIFKDGFNHATDEDLKIAGEKLIFAGNPEAAVICGKSGKLDNPDNCVIMCELIPGFSRRNCVHDLMDVDNCACDFHVIKGVNNVCEDDVFYYVRRVNSRVLPLYQLSFRDEKK